MRWTNKYNLPEPVVRAILKDPYSKGDADFSVTEIIDSPRVRALKVKHDNDIEEDVSDMVFSLFGRAMHHVMEQGAEGVANHTSEERLFLTVDGYRISGAMDLQHHTDGGIVILDHKVTTVYSFQADKSDWHKQLNVYAHLVRENKQARVFGLRIVAFLRDWASRNRGRDNYPPAPIQTLDIPLWEPEVAASYVRERVRLHSAAHANAFAGAGLDYCTDEERWLASSTYAVIKKGAARAKSLHPTYEGAMGEIEDLGPGWAIESRGGEAKRCIGNWCKVSRWCEQYQREIGGRS